MYSGTNKQRHSLEEQDLFDKVDIELQQPDHVYTSPDSAGLPCVAVYTGIEGGVESEALDGKKGSARGGTVGAGGGEELERGTGIVTTIRMEHSYV